MTRQLSHIHRQFEPLSRLASLEPCPNQLLVVVGIVVNLIGQ